ncbi:cytochrome ubiquinol oxidase subunit I [Coralloluteibacterium thermophilus]|uniref:Cytochrome ubiquinol oxidase subunit I n=1 Tax=Coralloluteibacterium thermophilum TaxID=2707049 RepID=A0ABV9NH81_9GAMM
MDPLLLSRIQFAFVVSFHILFPATTIGLASWLAFVEWRWLRTGKTVWRELYFFWTKIFAVTFGMGVVSGIVMTFQFGTNWAGLSSAAGSILGPLLSYEVLTAFFLEASFLGVMLFGWNRVRPSLHFLATCMVAAGTLISAFWIIAANSWLQTPAGFEVVEGAFHPASWREVIFNPSFPIRLTHMVMAAFLATCFIIGGTGAWYLRRNRHVEEGRRMLRLAVVFAAIVAPTQIFIGDLHGLGVLEHQPSKLAAIEGHWDHGEEGAGVPLVLFAIPDAENERNIASVEVPRLASLILTRSLDGTVPALADFAPEDRPPVWPVFWAFRVMVGLGFAMLLLAAWSLVQWKRKRLYTSPALLRAWAWMWPSGLIAVVAGWITAEIGRQPWVVFGQLRTADALSDISGAAVATSLTAFVVIYFVVFGTGGWFIANMIRRGPAVVEPPQHDTETKSASRPMSAADDEPLEGTR